MSLVGEGDDSVPQPGLRGGVLAKGRKAKSHFARKLTDNGNNENVHNGRSAASRGVVKAPAYVLESGDPLSLMAAADQTKTQATTGTLTAMTHWLDRNYMGKRIRKHDAAQMLDLSFKWRVFTEFQAACLVLKWKWWWIIAVSASILLDTIIASLVTEDVLSPTVAMVLHCLGDLFFTLEFIVNGVTTERPLRSFRLWYELVILCMALTMDWVLNLFYRTIALGEEPQYGLWKRGPIMLLRFWRLRKLEFLVPQDTKSARALRRARPSRVVRRVLMKANSLLWPLVLPLLFLTFLAGLITRSVIDTFEEGTSTVVQTYFNTVLECMATYLLVAIRANSEWGFEIYQPLEQSVPGLAAVFIFLVAGVDIWLMSTLLGILVEAVIAAGQDDDATIQWYLQQQVAQSDRLRTIFERMDVNRDGSITLQELNFAYQSDPALAMHLGMSLEEITELFHNYDIEGVGAVTVPVMLFATIMAFFHNDMDGHVEHYILKTALNTLSENETTIGAIDKHLSLVTARHDEFKKVLLSSFDEHASLLEGFEAEFKKIEESITALLGIIVEYDWNDQDKVIPPKAQNVATMQLRKNLHLLEAAVDEWIQATQSVGEGDLASLDLHTKEVHLASSGDGDAHRESKAARTDSHQPRRLEIITDAFVEEYTQSVAAATTPDSVSLL